MFGKGLAKASAPGAAIIQFFGGIHEVYFPFVLMKPKLIVAMIAGGATADPDQRHLQQRPAVAGGAGLGLRGLHRRADQPRPTCWASPCRSSVGAAASFLVAAVILKADKTEEAEDQLVGATHQMEAMKGKSSSISAALTGGGTAVATKPIRQIVFACDAGMGSSAMGASVLRKKIHDSGHTEVTVVNKAISNLTDDFDVVVSHQDLTDRARQATPSAVHVSVDNFMGSPRYDEIVELVEQANAEGGAAAARPPRPRRSAAATCSAGTRSS